MAGKSGFPWLAGMLALMLGCNGGEGSSGPSGKTDSLAAASQDEFVAKFLDIVCGPDGTSGALPQACSRSNEDAVDLYDCLWYRADFGNDGIREHLSENSRKQLSTGGATPLCARLNTPGYACKDWMDFAFKGGTPPYEGNIWKYSDPKPSDAAAMLKTCAIE